MLHTRTGLGTQEDHRQCQLLDVDMQVVFEIAIILRIDQVHLVDHDKGLKISLVGSDEISVDKALVVVRQRCRHHDPKLLNIGHQHLFLLGLAGSLSR